MAALHSKCVDSSPQFIVICKLGEPALCHLLQVMDKEVKCDRAQDWPLWCLLLAWVEYNQVIATLWDWSSNHFFAHLFVQPSRPWYTNLVTRILKKISLRGLKQPRSITEGSRVGQTWFSLGKAVLTVPNHFVACAQKWVPRGDPLELWNLCHFSNGRGNLNRICTGTVQEVVNCRTIILLQFSYASTELKTPWIFLLPVANTD